MAFADAQSGALILDSNVPIEITLGESCAKGDLLGYSSGWKKTLATAGSVIQARCVAGMAGKTGDKIVAYFGKVRLGGRLSGMTIGNPLYVDEGTAYGKYTDTIPSTTNDATKVVGYAVSATEAVIDCMANIDSLSA
jgi:hypothetical protein